VEPSPREGGYATRRYRLADIVIIGAIVGLSGVITAALVWAVVSLRF
jgi:hypothetical protein